MDLRNPRIRGIVEVMDDQQHHDREVGLGSALERLSAARQRRGPVGVLDPFEIVGAEDRLAVTQPPRRKPRSGLFSFSDRARAAADAYEGTDG